MKMTNEEVHEFMRVRRERFSALSYEQKINACMLGYQFSMVDKDSYHAKKNLLRVIELMFEKIIDRHCDY